jgi:AraC-like DNA-binding protein
MAHLQQSVATTAATERHLREINLRRFEILETEFQWQAGQRMGYDYSVYELHCRLQPYTVLAQAWADGGEESTIGRLSLFVPGKKYGAQAASKQETVRTIVYRFDTDWLCEATGRDVEWDRLSAAELMDIQHPHIEKSMRRIADELARPQYGSEALIEALSVTVAIDLVRHFGNDGVDEDQQGHKLSARRLKRIHELTAATEGRAITAEEIAFDLGLSVTYLRRVFRNTTGQTLHDFLEGARIAKACALLTETDMPLKVVAFMSGFAQHSTFSYAFKRETGLTPSEYRARKLI